MISKNLHKNHRFLLIRFTNDVYSTEFKLKWTMALSSSVFPFVAQFPINLRLLFLSFPLPFLFDYRFNINISIVLFLFTFVHCLLTCTQKKCFGSSTQCRMTCLNNDRIKYTNMTFKSFFVALFVLFASVCVCVSEVQFSS